MYREYILFQQRDTGRIKGQLVPNWFKKLAVHSTVSHENYDHMEWHPSACLPGTPGTAILIGWSPTATELITGALWSLCHHPWGSGVGLPPQLPPLLSYWDSGSPTFVALKPHCYLEDPLE